MLWVIVLPMVIHIIRNREDHSKEELLTSIIYLAGLPIVSYDFFVYSSWEGIHWTMGGGLLNMIFRYSFLTSGFFLVIKGMAYLFGIRKTGEKSECL